MAVPVFAFSAKSQLAATMRSPAKSIKFRLRSVGTFLQRRSQCQGHSICKDKQKNSEQTENCNRCFRLVEIQIPIDTAAKTEFSDCKKKSSWDATEIQRAKVDV